MKPKYGILLFLTAIALCWGIYAFVQFRRQKEKDRQFFEDCANSEIIKFRDGDIRIYLPDEALVDPRNIEFLHIRNGAIVDTLQYERIWEYYEIQQFDLRINDTLRINMPYCDHLDLYGFRNEIEYRYPNKILGCNFQKYIIDSTVWEVEHYSDIRLDRIYEQ